MMRAFPGRLINQRVDLAELQDGGDETLSSLVVQFMRQAQALVLFDGRQVTAQADDEMRFVLALRRQLRIGPRQTLQQVIALGQQRRRRD